MRQFRLRANVGSHVVNSRFHGTTRATFSFLKASEGGQSFTDAKRNLEDKGITDVRRESSIYVGHTALSVPVRFGKRAERILFGR